MNVQVDPCDDFYSYACGNFVKNTEFKDNEHSVTTMKQIQERIDERLKELLTSPNKEDDINAYEAAKLFYYSCEESRNGHSNISHFVDILDALGGFPILKSKTWNGKDLHWTGIIKKLHQLGFPTDYLMKLSVIPSEKDFDSYGGTFILELILPTTILTKEKLNHVRMKEEIERYKIYILNVLKEIKGDSNINSQEIDDMVNFETKLVRLTERGHLSYQNLTIRDLNMHFPFFEWSDYVSSFLPDETSINGDDKILISDPSYLHGLRKLLLTTIYRTLTNYLLWRVTDFSSVYLNNYLKRLHNDYHIVKNLTCVELVRNEIPLISSAMYARAYLDNRNKEDLRDQVVDDVEGILDFTMGLLTWLDEASRDSARMRLKETVRFITVPQELGNDFISRYYSKLSLKTGPILNQVLKVRKFDHNKNYQKFRKSVEKHEWTRFADLVSVLKYKSSDRYILSIPAPLIEEQLTHINTSVIDYATVGVVVARDYIYRFMGLYDPVGTTFKSHGSWWTNESLDDFKPHMQCFIDKYGQLQTPDGVKLRSNYFKYENIVDVGALRAAHTAFKYLGDTAEERLPGIQFNEAKQIFWTKAAQNWCSKYTPDELKRELIRGNEVPGKFRVNGAIIHLRDFGKEFNCKVGSNMFPDKNSCYGLWDTEKQFY